MNTKYKNKDLKLNGIEYYLVCDKITIKNM